MMQPLKEKELMSQINEEALGAEIRQGVEGQAGI